MDQEVLGTENGNPREHEARASSPSHKHEPSVAINSEKQVTLDQDGSMQNGRTMEGDESQRPEGAKNEEGVDGKRKRRPRVPKIRRISPEKHKPKERIKTKKRRTLKTKKLKTVERIKKKKKEEKKEDKKQERLRKLCLNNSTGLINFFSSLANVPIVPLPPPPKKEKVLSEEELMIQRFQEKFPAYVSHAGKIIYPVEDELFDQYPWLSVKAKSTIKVVPEYKSPINQYHLKYLLKICTFFERFDDLLQGPNFTKEELSAAINYSGPDCIDLVNDVHIALLYVFIDEFEEGSKFEYAKEYGIIFYLIKHLKDDFLELHFRVFWPEVMVSLVSFPEFEEMFNAESRDIFREIAEAGIAGYNYIDPLRKLKAINQLIELHHELHVFRESLTGLFDKQNELGKEKVKIQTELKGVESDLFTLKNEMESTENNLKVQEEVLRNLPRQEMQKKRHEIDELKRKINKIQSQINKAENQSSKLTSSFDDLKVKAPYLIHPTQLLGKDSERNLYFFFSDEPSSIYCQEYNENKSIPAKWIVYNTEESVNILLDRLNRNAKRELSLHTSIRNLLKDNYITLSPSSSSGTAHPANGGEKIVNEIEETMEKVREYESIYQPQEGYIKAKTRINRNLHLLEIFRDKIHKTDLVERATCQFILNLLLEVEQEFTAYLRTRKCRWMDRQGRETLRKDALENLSEAKVGELLVLLNSRFIHIETFIRKDENNNQQNDIDENSENEDNYMLNLKKRKNKLWKNTDKDQDEEMVENHFDEDFETDPKYFSKRKVLKTWGFYNEKFKQAWETFVSNAEGNHIGALYLGAVIFIEIICRYVTRKNQKADDDGDDRPRETTGRGEREHRGDAREQHGQSSDYIFRKRKGGRIQAGEGSAVEKFNLRVKHRLDRDRRNEQRQREVDPYDDIDDYSPERLKTIRNTRALTKKLNKAG